MTSKFTQLRDLLSELRITLGQDGIVSASWNGNQMTIMLSIPSSVMKPFVANFDDPGDYAPEAEDDIVRQFVARSRAHFGN
jgi:hypothetical protein